MQEYTDKNGIREGKSGEEGTWQTTEAFYGLICPECERLNPQTAGDIIQCQECSNEWQAFGRENCLECGKPLGSNGTLCHSCFEDKSEAAQ